MKNLLLVLLFSSAAAVVARGDSAVYNTVTTIGDIPSMYSVAKCFASVTCAGQRWTQEVPFPPPMAVDGRQLEGMTVFKFSPALLKEPTYAPPACYARSFSGLFVVNAYDQKDPTHTPAYFYLFHKGLVGSPKLVVAYDVRKPKAVQLTP